MVPYQIIQSKRKSLALTFDKQGGLIVRSPRGISKEIIQQFVVDNLSWIHKHQPRVRAVLEQKYSFDFSDGLTLPWLGRNLIIATGTAAAIIDSAIIFPSVNPQKRELCYFNLLKEYGESHLPLRVKYYGEIMGSSPSQIKITSARTRWGSCNINGNLCFSRFLLCCSPSLIDYVVVHELAHLEQHNHSTAFYRLVEKVLPDFRSRQKELSQIRLPF